MWHGRTRRAGKAGSGRTLKESRISPDTPGKGKPEKKQIRK
jgi:hypothetical protein